MASKLAFALFFVLALVVAATYANAEDDAQRAAKSRRLLNTTSRPARNFTRSPSRNCTTATGTGSTKTCCKADIRQRVRVMRMQKEIKALKDQVAQLKKPDTATASNQNELQCVYVQSKDASATCMTGWTALSCSCSNGCGSYTITGNSRTCNCDATQCKKVSWAAANCCRMVQSSGRS